MKLENYFTDYDESVAGEIKLDPLGMLAIWSSLGQCIFNNRVSSISNDVRNYTLNLLHHDVIRHLVSDGSRPLPSSLVTKFDNKDSLAFKQACLLLLEDVFVLTVVENEGAEDSAEFDATGILGITRARRVRDDTKRNLGEFPLKFSSAANRFLTNQLSLGVSGRYKTPLVEMKFFDKRYEYRLPEFKEQWQQFETFFLSSNKALLGLSKILGSFLYEAIKRESKGQQIQFNNVPKDLKAAYLQQFRKPESVGAYSRKFWLKVTGLDQGPAGKILKVLDQRASDAGTSKMLSNKEVIEYALALASDQDKTYLDRITQIEPFLADLDLLFWIILSNPSQTFEDIEKVWKDLQRNDNTLPHKASELQQNRAALTDKLSTLAKKRLTDLMKIASVTGLKNQILFLLKYHHDVMESRGQGEWSVVDPSGKIRNYVRKHINLDREKWPPGRWTHTYYIPEFRQLARGLAGDAL